ncbi:hypothetical protein HDU84_006253 [Entophlyctis sp. JEL0112]|nr:hypothetical protein HDU84_006253 [Entophlyctis sp. JEL0112]
MPSFAAAAGTGASRGGAMLATEIPTQALFVVQRDEQSTSASNATAGGGLVTTILGDSPHLSVTVVVSTIAGLLLLALGVLMCLCLRWWTRRRMNSSGVDGAASSLPGDVSAGGGGPGRRHVKLVDEDDGDVEAIEMQTTNTRGGASASAGDSPIARAESAHAGRVLPVGRPTAAPRLQLAGELFPPLEAVPVQLVHELAQELEPDPPRTHAFASPESTTLAKYWEERGYLQGAGGRGAP